MRLVARAEARAGDLDRPRARGHGHADELVEVGGRLTTLCDLDAALLGQRMGVDEVDLLLGVPAQHAVQHRDGQQARVVLGQAALVARPRCGRSSRPRPARRRSARAGSTGAGRAPSASMSSAPQGRDVDRVGDHSPGQRGDHLLGGLDAGAVLGLDRRGAEVRGDHDAIHPEQRVLGDRLLGEHVERSSGHVAGAQGVDQRVVVDQLAAGAVDDPHALAHGGEGLGVEHLARLGRVRAGGS